MIFRISVPVGHLFAPVDNVRKELSLVNPNHIKLSCDPARSAENLQRYLQEVPACRVFNPNVDSAFLTEGDVDNADGWYVLNWRSGEFGL